MSTEDEEDEEEEQEERRLDLFSRNDGVSMDFRFFVSKGGEWLKSSRSPSDSSTVASEEVSWDSTKKMSNPSSTRYDAAE